MNSGQVHESQYERVYGDTCAVYSTRGMLGILEPIGIRFSCNVLDPETLPSPML